MIEKQVAIVSGGAGGIGSAVSSRLALLGYTVIVADTSAKEAQQVVESLTSMKGQEHRVVIGDLTQLETNQRAAEVAAACGTVTALVNAVGISPKRSGEKINFFDISPDLWDQVMAVNVKAPFMLIQQAHAYMPTDGSASIVNLLSITSKLGSGGLSTDTFQPQLPSTAAYAASKAALQNMTATLSRELSSFSIRVNGVAPGLIWTEMTEETLVESEVSSQIPMGRFGTTKEVVDAIEFLLSEKSTYINGASIDINGAWYTC
ncbi:3-oxoacyl-[acyl-carrier-protein] reductase [Yaniella flava]|uniref:3-oxoacyl-[acyl-carrier-protein] reductase n=1 Tax=Yaniella flava TaxID=287930 RepID=A0ABN2UB13_9MICC